MKFVLFVEGHTEDKLLPAFLKRWLDARLPRRVGIKPVRFDGWAELRREVKRKAHLHLNNPRAPDVVAVVSLLDLYGPTFYPSHLNAAAERYDWAKAWIEKEVAHPKFRHFFAVHEVEAWLLSQPDLFPPEVRSGFPGGIGQPEAINFDEPPAKLLGRLYRERLRREYKKVTHGKDLFDRLDPQVAVDRCPRLREMLEEMLQLAKDSA
jgi:hypothetical protein